jgi:hypothetical protein
MTRRQIIADDDSDEEPALPPPPAPVAPAAPPPQQWFPEAASMAETSEALLVERLRQVLLTAAPGTSCRSTSWAGSSSRMPLATAGLRKTLPWRG